MRLASALVPQRLLDTLVITFVFAAVAGRIGLLLRGRDEDWTIASVAAVLHGTAELERTFDASFSIEGGQEDGRRNLPERARTHIS
jgi:hypothetical protein